MEIVSEFLDLKREVKLVRDSGKTIGFVATMGFLHRGHISLLEEARRQTDFVVLSIFVNPIQFGRGEDFTEYPRDLESDAAKARQAGCDLIFCPRENSMYPRGYSTFVEVEGITEGLCGASRPGHFRGVTTVVAKLFNLIEPHKAFFGQKDAQQALIIRKMVEDLNMNLEVIVCPTIREEDGVAMSSRNSYLNPRERAAAAVLYRSLCIARDTIGSGERDPQAIRDMMEKIIKREPLLLIEYIEIVNGRNLDAVTKLQGAILIALAVKVGQTRLIDNLLLEV